MKRPYRFSFVCLAFAAALCGSAPLRAQNYVVYDNFAQLQERINRAGDTTLLLNFWATWCSSCVEELPCFDELRDYYGPENIQVVLISLDFKTQLEKKFVPFLLKQRIRSEVGLMADRDLDAWIPAFYEAWDGAIPATMVMKGKKRRFIVGKFDTFEDLESFVRPFVTDSAQVTPDAKPCNGGKK